ncbi:MAG: hypothetical protein WC547_09960 [Candidatus Omnitrophota bacterium]
MARDNYSFIKRQKELAKKKKKEEKIQNKLARKNLQAQADAGQAPGDGSAVAEEQ